MLFRTVTARKQFVGVVTPWAADYDNDGNSDASIGSHGSVKLMRNTGSRFEDATAAAGLKAKDFVKSSSSLTLITMGTAILSFMICRGRRRLWYSGCTPTRATASLNNGSTGCPEAVSTIVPWTTVADFNADGLLDIHTVFPGIRDSSSGIAGRTRPGWLASQGIWFNEGGLTQRSRPFCADT